MKKTISCSITLYKDTFYLQAYSVNVDGFRDAADNPIHIIKKEEGHLLGLKTLKTLKDCKFGIPNDDPNDMSNYKHFLKLVGAKSSKDLMQNGHSVSVLLQGEKIRVSPEYFNGKYLTSSPDRYMYCSLDPDDITKTVLAAFERCHP